MPGSRGAAYGARVGRNRRRLLTPAATAAGLLGLCLAVATGCGAGTPGTGAAWADRAGSEQAASGAGTPTARAASATTSRRPSTKAAAATPRATAAVRPAAGAGSSTAAATAEVTVRTERVTKAVKYRTVTRKDPDLDKGETRVVREGVKGVLELVFRVTYTDGVRSDRELASKRTVRAPVDRVVAVGTRVPQPEGADCDPNYSGDCVPVDTDVDCAGGSGNGPSYVEGPVRVVGTDIYGLDRDGDGVGCD